MVRLIFERTEVQFTEKGIEKSKEITAPTIEFENKQVEALLTSGGMDEYHGVWVKVVGAEVVKDE